MSQVRKRKRSSKRLPIERVWQRIVWAFYILGVIIFLEFIHELYHFYFCGGEFLSGVGYFRGTSHFGGLTYCARNNGGGGEIIPSVTEIALFGLMIWGKIKTENPKASVSLLNNWLAAIKSVINVGRRVLVIDLSKLRQAFA